MNSISFTIQKWIFGVLSCLLTQLGNAQLNGSYAIAGSDPAQENFYDIVAALSAVETEGGSNHSTSGNKKYSHQGSSLYLLQTINSQIPADIEAHSLLSHDSETCQFTDSIYLDIVNNSNVDVSGIQVTFQLNNLEIEDFLFDDTISAQDTLVVNLGYFDFSKMGGSLMSFEVSLTDPDLTDEFTENNLLEVILPSAEEVEINEFKANDCDDSIELSIIDHDYTSISWSNGAEGPFIVVDETGFYTVEVTDSSGCIHTTEYELIIE